MAGDLLALIPRQRSTQSGREGFELGGYRVVQCLSGAAPWEGSQYQVPGLVLTIIENPQTRSLKIPTL